LADSLDAAGRSWRDYGPRPSDVGVVWTGFDAIRQIRFGSDWQTDIIAPETRFLSDVRAGALADVTWVTPDFASSDHAQIGLKQHRVARGQRDLGPQWVANVVNAVGRSRFWGTTAIVVIWDDWGGWYDHVPPPQLDELGLGFRVPMIVIGPYAKRGYVSHVQHEFGSLLKFAEEVFALPSLGTTDVRADDLADCFDFRQRPRPLVQVATKLSLEDFLNLQPSSVAPDDDD
jgi:phospholipase C